MRDVRVRGHRVRALSRAIVVLVVGATLALAAFDFVTASPRLCASCHEMEARTESWEQSAHSGVACVECHETPREGFQRPLRLVDRSLLLGRDTVRHFVRGNDDPVDGPVAGVPPMTDEVCLQCHDPNRKATSGYRILIDHVVHAQRNGSCVSCHVRTAHPAEDRGRALTLMGQCFDCHGTDEAPEASPECGVCHPQDFELVPVSHQAAWNSEHGGVAVSDPGQCRMCHTQSLCDDCHGLEMPHPMEWARGPIGHAASALSDRTVCARCHGSRPDMCTICHHEGYDPGKGPWMGQHPADATARGVSSCMECHAPKSCIRCHTSRG